jgi:hypothetical protein
MGQDPRSSGTGADEPSGSHGDIGVLNGAAAIPPAIEAALLRQEHRTVVILYNFFVRRRRFSEDDPRRKAIAWSLLWRLLSPATAAVGAGTVIAAATVFLAWQANVLVRDQNKRIEQQTFLMEAGRRQHLIPFMLVLMKEIDKHVEGSRQRDGRIVLPTRIVSRIASLTKDLMPYRTFDSISGELSDNLTSPERGQLLLFLVSSNIDLPSLANIASFAASDLTGADLHDLDLKGLDLAGATLWGANLRFTDLSGARLNGTNLWSSKLHGALLRGANLATSSLWVADLTDADMRDVDLTEAFLKGANFRGCDMRNAVLENVSSWQDIKNISGANIFGVKRAPPGFIAWARSVGALERPGDNWRKHSEEMAH